MKLLMIRICIYVCVLAIFLLLYARYIEKNNIFFPSKDINLNPKNINLDFKDIYFNSDDTYRLNAWFIPSANAKFTLLFFHGNAGNISDRLDKILIFNKLGLNVFIIDYRGYGNSQGAPSENSFYKDARASYDYLIKEEKTPKDRIIIYGESLGGAVAVDLASKIESKALIIDSSFTRAADMAKILFPMLPSFLLSIKFDSIKKIKNIKSEKLFIHSVDDEVIPFKLGEKLFKEASIPKYFLEIEGGHNTNFLDSKEKYIAGIKSFLIKL